jgi:hypothetical protein
MADRSLILIHGVGCPQPGEILQECLRELVKHEIKLSEKEDLHVNGRAYPRCSATGRLSEVIEVNWSDVLRPEGNILGIARHLILLLFAFLRLCGEPSTTGRRKPFFGRLYGFYFESMFVWCLYPPMLMLFIWSYDHWLVQTFAVACFLIILLPWIVFLSSLSKSFYVGYAWYVAMLVAAAVSILGLADRVKVLQIATFVYSNTQSLGAILLILCAIEAGFYSCGQSKPFKYFLSRLAFLYVPFALASALGAIAWAAVLSCAYVTCSKLEMYNDWGTRFLQFLNYDLGFMEYVFCSAVFCIGLLALAGLARYRFRCTGNPRARRPGLAAQDWLMVLLVSTPLILIVVALCLLVNSLLRGSSEGQTTTDVMQIYAISSTRIIPFMFFLIGPGRILVDVLGDVLFYLLPGRRTPATAETARARLREVIAAVQSQSPGNKVVVLAHSQGSVIAADTIGRLNANDCKLITIGSPIQSLYERFLFSTSTSRVTNFTAPKHWTNIYRRDDYIAGPIRLKGVKNYRLGNGGHTGYWCDPFVIREVVTAEF